MTTNRRGKRSSRRAHRVLARLRGPVALACGGFAVIAGAISANALLLQPGRHPAPLFAQDAGDQTDSVSHDSKPQAPNPARFRPTAASPGTADVAAVQRALARAAYGPIRTDGVFGPQTREAIARFQADHGLSATGEISDALLLELRAAGALEE